MDFNLMDFDHGRNFDSDTAPRRAARAPLYLVPTPLVCAELRRARGVDAPGRRA